jgi:DcmR-like sensory protein
VTRPLYSLQVTKSWADFLNAADPCAHAVQIYVDVDELAGSVATYLARGFEAGEPAVVVATADHAERFFEKLNALGWNASRIEREAVLRIEDADATLAAIMQGRLSSSHAAFEQIVGRMIDVVAKRAPERTVRVFGEMVDLLCGRGETKAAADLEELWNGLARRLRFSLLCGYRLDVFDRASQVGTLPDVCRAHSHVLPAWDPAHLARSVDLALEEVLGPAEAGKVYALVGEQIRRGRVPSPQLVLMWVSANMPALADRILASARRRYVDAVPA